MSVPTPVCECAICVDYTAGRTAAEVAALHPPRTLWSVFGVLKKHGTGCRPCGQRRFSPLRTREKLALLRQTVARLLAVLPADAEQRESMEARAFAVEALRATVPASNGGARG